MAKKSKKPTAKQRVGSFLKEAKSPIEKGTMYGLPLGIGASIFNSNDLASTISQGREGLERLIENPHLGEGAYNTVSRLFESFRESRTDNMYDILTDSTGVGLGVLGAMAAITGYEVYKKQNLTSKIYTGLTLLPIVALQTRLGHSVANSIDGVDVWDSLVKPAVTYVTNL